MREVTAGGKVYSVRALTRGEVKQLRREGLDPTTLKSENAEDAVERVFGLVFSEEQLAEIDRLPNPEAMGLWRGVLRETYGSKDEEKN